MSNNWKGSGRLRICRWIGGEAWSRKRCCVKRWLRILQAHDLNGPVPTILVVINNCAIVIPYLNDVALLHEGWYHKTICRRDETVNVTVIFLPSDEIELNSTSFHQIFVCGNCSHQASDEASA